jgi:hypothetical protein
MARKAILTAAFAAFLTATASWALGGGAHSGARIINVQFGVPIDLLMPDPPTGVVAQAGNGEASVTFERPRSEGIKPITLYTVTSHPGNLRASGTHSPIIVRDLTNGRPYTFTVTATNSIGTGLSSALSNTVTPEAG